MTPAERDAATIRRQQERIDELEEALRQAKAWLVSPVALPREWGLTPAQKKVLLALYLSSGGFLSHEVLHEVFARPESNGDIRLATAQKIVRLRKKLAPIGVAFRSHYGLGYELIPASKAIIKAALEQRAVA